MIPTKRDEIMYAFLHRDTTDTRLRILSLLFFITRAISNERRQENSELRRKYG